jgi:hypothetical protein
MISNTKASATNFQDDSIVVASATRSTQGLTSLGPDSIDTNSIKDWLAKPVRVASGSVSTSDSYNATLWSASIANLLLSNAMYANKHSGYNLIRATANLKVVINANPFQACKLILTFIPMYEHMTSAEKAMRNTTLAQVSTQPNIEIDAQETSLEMSIPYISPYFYYDRESGLYDWGTAFLKVLSPLRVGSAGENTFDYTIFVHFTDVELAGPIFGPESGVSPSRGRPKPNSKTLARENRRVHNDGWVENTADAVADVADILGEIPGASAITNIVSAGADIVSRISSIFGWSKPLSQAVTEPVALLPFKNLGNSQGVSHADPLSMGNNSALEPIVNFAGSSVDEMSFAYLKKIPGYMGYFNWNTSQTVGTLLASRDLRMDSFLWTGTRITGGGSAAYRVGPPFSYLSMFFDKWRGGVDVTFKFVKTQFHTGRVVVSFTPTQTALSLDETNYVLREIVDLRSANEVTLHIPWIKGDTYLPTGFGSQYSNTDFHSLGTLEIHVLNELRCPETVSNNIEVITYFNGADDFELAVPIMVPYGPFSPESGLSATTNSTLIKKGIGSSQEVSISATHDSLAVSDPFVSLKQMLNSSRRIFSTDADINGQNISINPSAIPVFTMGGPNPAYPADTIYGDFIHLISGGYAFCRGGYRLTHVGRASAGMAMGYLDWEKVTGRGVSVHSPNGTATAPADNSSNYVTPSQGGLEIFRGADSGTFDALLPHFGFTPIRRVRFQSSANPDMPLDPDSYRYRLVFHASNSSLITNRGWVRSGADDFCLGYFIGFPPMLRSYTPV